jgi:lipoprotein-anchoring transpeptidase ErfK/SrfK
MIGRLQLFNMLAGRLKAFSAGPIQMGIPMQHNDFQLPRIVVLVLLAAGLGIAILQVDASRRSDLVPAANAASSNGAAVSPAAGQGAAAAGTLVADAGAATPAPTAPVTTTPAPTTEVAPPAPEPTVAPIARQRGGVSCEQPHRTVQINHDAIIRSRPNGRALGSMPAQSRYLGQSMTAWVQAVSKDGRWGRVTLPWSKPVGRAGWVRIDEFAGRTTTTMVVADLSERRVHVYRGCRELFSVKSAIGRAGSPSPKGRFWVTDRVPVPGAQQASFGSYAFGLSTVQPNLPAGWTGGDQMAIHGTGAPGSIGQAASAGCLRVSEEALARLKPLLRAGTPVVIHG